MLRSVMLSLLALLSWQAQAPYQCEVNPQNDIFITPQQVQVVGASGNLVISPQGDVTRNQTAVTLTAAQRQQAKAYQADLRQQLPWIEQGALAHLEKASVALNGVIAKELGSDSNVRARLTTLDTQLKQQMARILEPRSDGIAFHHQAVKQVEQDGRQLVQQALGGVLQDSLNEMGVKQLSSGGNPLQAMMGNLGNLQQAIQTEWNSQELTFQRFGKDVCQRVISLENQRKQLLKSLP
ncbi:MULTISPECIES: DUF2884 domain-containing protein [Symbiopectobacterium]|uniref:DUF2884 domain-containing protein n=1 Tax=Symbiopectobacterium TaxID=801 RepID=UPI001A1A8F5A|nr:MULTISPECIES: DUF2884 domain-containing protein [Symbiopectobacterium]MBG6247143.1 DUF2884 family protein [Candidatus Symbiopectobacterium sp. PLON1]MBT9428205.1 DUF2884 domain-containing protein [Candidatus Symbiopectobacterium endolongispinus]